MDRGPYRPAAAGDPSRIVLQAHQSAPSVHAAHVWHVHDGLALRDVRAPVPVALLWKDAARDVVTTLGRAQNGVSHFPPRHSEDR